MVHIPKTIRTYCWKLKKHTTHKVSQYKTVRPPRLLRVREDMTWSKRVSVDRPSLSSRRKPSKPRRSPSSSSAFNPSANLSESSREPRPSSSERRRTKRARSCSEQLERRYREITTWVNKNLNLSYKTIVLLKVVVPYDKLWAFWCVY